MGGDLKGAARLAEAHYTLGLVDWQEGEFTATIHEMRAAIAAKPNYAEAYYLLGTALKQSGAPEEAMGALKGRSVLILKHLDRSFFLGRSCTPAATPKPAAKLSPRRPASQRRTLNGSLICCRSLPTT